MYIAGGSLNQLRSVQPAEEDQCLPLRNTAGWHKGYFELKGTQKITTQKIVSC